MEKVEFEKAKAELPTLRSFIDFVNKQVGVYSDALSSFEGNKVRIERQVARVQRPVGQQIKDGRPVIMWASFEDPSSPDAIHHRIIRADEFITSPDAAITFSHDQMHKLFVHIKKGISKLILKYTGHLPGAPDASEIVSIAIQNP